MSSTGALSLKKVPEKMVVIGAGVIGVELVRGYLNHLAFYLKGTGCYFLCVLYLIVLLWFSRCLVE